MAKQALEPVPHSWRRYAMRKRRRIELVKPWLRGCSYKPKSPFAHTGVNTMHEVRLPRLTAIWGIIFGISIVCSIALAQSAGPITPAAIAGPLPPPVMPPNEIKLTPVEQLGKFMLYDHTLSNPPGYACASATSRKRALRDPIPQLTSSGFRSQALYPVDSAIASRRAISTPPFVPLDPSLTPV
jgi:hypothetical protein